jgi:Tfp pilus assembly protein PilE
MRPGVLRANASRPRPRSLRRGSAGFTVLEWLMVVAVFWLLVLIVFFPFYGRGVERAHRVSCASNLQQIGTALMLYSYDHGGRFPAPTGFPADIDEYMKNQMIYACPASAEGKPAFSPPIMSPPGAPTPPPRIDYTYIGPASNDDRPTRAVLADSEPRHNGGANVLYVMGDVKWKPEAEWVRLGFGPLPPEGGQP